MPEPRWEIRNGALVIKCRDGYFYVRPKDFELQIWPHSTQQQPATPEQEKK